jgi:hypothetical protein
MHILLMHNGFMQEKLVEWKRMEEENIEISEYHWFL